MSLSRMAGWLMGAAGAMSFQAVTAGQTSSPPFRVSGVDLSAAASVEMTTTCREYGWDLEYSSREGSAEVPGTWIVTRECSDFFWGCLEATMNLAWSSDGMEATFLGSIAGQSGGEASATFTLRLLVEDTTAVVWPGGQVILDVSVPNGDCSPSFEDPDWPFECEVGVEASLQSGQPWAISIVGGAEIARFRLAADTLLQFESPPTFPQRHEESSAQGVADGVRSVESIALGCYGGSWATSTFELLGDRLAFSVTASGECGPSTDVPWWTMACSNASAEFRVMLTRPHLVLAESCEIWCGFSTYCWLGGSGSKGPVSAVLPPGVHSYVISCYSYRSSMFPSCSHGAGSARFFRLNAADVRYDGIVDAEDLAMLLGHWGQEVNPARVEADVNLDGAVDAVDVAMVIGAWGTNGCVPIPEVDLSCP